MMRIETLFHKRTDRQSPARSRAAILARPGLWLGGAAALAVLAFFEPGILIGLQGAVVIAAIAATKDIVWDFVIRGREEGKMDTDTIHASAGFAVIYLIGVMTLQA